jgi:hypothetical protein
MNHSSNSAMVLTLQKVGEYWTIKGSEGTFMALTENSNTLNASSTADGNTAKWSISIDSDGNATISNVNYSNRKLQYNYNSGNDMFRCYTGSQQKVAIYKETSDSVVTDIGSAKADSASSGAIYTLQGAKKKPNSPMKRGIYVAKGKKWIVK